MFINAEKRKMIVLRAVCVCVRVCIILFPFSNQVMSKVVPSFLHKIHKLFVLR